MKLPTSQRTLEQIGEYRTRLERHTGDQYDIPDAIAMMVFRGLEQIKQEPIHAAKAVKPDMTRAATEFPVPDEVIRALDEMAETRERIGCEQWDWPEMFAAAVETTWNGNALRSGLPFREVEVNPPQAVVVNLRRDHSKGVMLATIPNPQQIGPPELRLLSVPLDENASQAMADALESSGCEYKCMTTDPEPMPVWSAGVDALERMARESDCNAVALGPVIEVMRGTGGERVHEELDAERRSRAKRLLLNEGTVELRLGTDDLVDGDTFAVPLRKKLETWLEETTGFTLRKDSDEWTVELDQGETVQLAIPDNLTAIDMSVECFRHGCDVSFTFNDVPGDHRIALADGGSTKARWRAVGFLAQHGGEPRLNTEMSPQAISPFRVSVDVKSELNCHVAQIPGVLHPDDSIELAFSEGDASCVESTIKREYGARRINGNWSLDEMGVTKLAKRDDQTAVALAPLIEAMTAEHGVGEVDHPIHRELEMAREDRAKDLLLSNAQVELRIHPQDFAIPHEGVNDVVERKLRAWLSHVGDVGIEKVAHPSERDRHEWRVVVDDGAAIRLSLPDASTQSVLQSCCVEHKETVALKLGETGSEVTPVPNHERGVSLAQAYLAGRDPMRGMRQAQQGISR